MRFPALCLAFLVSFAFATARAETPVRVFAAASLTPVLEEMASHWQREGHPRPVLVFGASAVLARQIEAGAPADVYLSADGRWMDRLERKGLLAPGTRRNLLGNTLVLAAPKGRGFPVTLAPGNNLAAFEGRLCIGEPDTVPAGSHAREALVRLGMWNALRGRIVAADDVRTVLAFVERGECAAGVIYATDARSSTKVERLATFPGGAHPPIVYPAAAMRRARAPAADFLRFLSSPAAADVFRRHGFTVLAR